jgi:hypothetical protein
MDVDQLFLLLNKLLELLYLYLADNLRSFSLSMTQFYNLLPQQILPSIIILMKSSHESKRLSGGGYTLIFIYLMPSTIEERRETVALFGTNIIHARSLPPATPFDILVSYRQLRQRCQITPQKPTKPLKTTTLNQYPLADVRLK